MKFRSGVRLLVRCQVNADTVVQAGDLLYLDSNKVAPASDFTWTTDLATTQAAFAAQFIGVAYQPSAAGETDPISVDVSPLAFYGCEAETSPTMIGEPLAPAEGFGNLSNTKLAATSAANAIGRLVKPGNGASAPIGVAFASAFFTASANANAAIG